MRIAVWKTGHEIAGRVAEAIAGGLRGTGIRHTNCAELSGNLLRLDDVVGGEDLHIAYGILRGTAEVFRECGRLGKPYIHLDRGYWKPGHYDGYYRVSLCGTHQTAGLDKLSPDYERWRALGVEMKPWRGFDHGKPVLVCPPTGEVAGFFGLDPELWRMQAVEASWWNDYECLLHQPYANVKVRLKGDTWPLDFSDFNFVKTFNSSVGWQALAAGIPCVSDPVHSIVGATYGKIPLEKLSEAQYMDRERLFGVMAGLQLTLEEIRAGKLWPLVSRLLHEGP